MPVKRLNYFNHQFLRAEDFSAEQGYHLSMRRLHNSLLHTPGVADGLKVVFDTGGTAVTVRQGTAIDKFGNEIILSNDTRVELSGLAAGAAAFITIAYREEQTDSTNETGIQGNTRWTESAVVTPMTTAPTDPTAQIVLGRVLRTGTTVTSVDETDRRYAGAVGGDMNTRSLSMKRDDVDARQWPKLSCSQANQTALTNSDLRFDSGRELLFQDNGQLRSYDNSHRIVFNRTNNRLEFYESGDILFNTGGVAPTEKLRITSGGNLGVGHNAPTSALHVGANRSARFELGTGYKLSVGSAGTVEVDSASGTGGRFFIGNDGNVGIGTASPRTKLDVGTGDISWGKSRLTADQGGSIELGGDSTTAGGGAPYIDFHYGNLVQDFNVRLQNDADGRLALAAQRFQVGGDIAGVALQPSDAPPNAGYIRFGDNTGWKLHIARSRDASGGALNAGTAGVLLSIQDNGNVGLGTVDTAPARLTIAGITAWNNGLILTGNTNNGVGLSLDNKTPGGHKYSLLSGGTGNTMGTGGFGIYDDSAATYRFVINASGLVGIGTASPIRPLHVIGNEIHSGGAMAGFSFNNRESGDFANADGNRWVWYSSSNIARLWCSPGADRISCTSGGDVTIAGRLGTNGQSPIPRTSGWGGGIHTWDLEVEGSAWCRNTWQTGPRDLAENYYSDKDLSAGDVVSMDDERDLIVPSAGAHDTMVMGIVSTKPGMLLNSDPDDVNRTDGTLAYPVALCGRVPCKVTDENGPIKRGDLLTSSSTPGHAMKAVPLYVDRQEIYRPGTIIGKALESFKSGKGMIEVFVSLR